MTTSTLEWCWRGTNIRLDIASSGTGPALLLLPALSSISTHHEMGPLAEHLAPRYSTACVGWPGFGARARPQVDWTPDAYSAFLAFLLTSVVPHPMRSSQPATPPAMPSNMRQAHRKPRRGWS
jgi:hypothetical protein